MRIRVLQPIAGEFIDWAPGQIIDVSEDEARVWADGTRAELAPGEQGAPDAPTPLRDFSPHGDDQQETVADAPHDPVSALETLAALETAARLRGGR